MGPLAPVVGLTTFPADTRGCTLAFRSSGHRRTGPPTADEGVSADSPGRDPALLSPLEDEGLSACSISGSLPASVLDEGSAALRNPCPMMRRTAFLGALARTVFRRQPNLVRRIKTNKPLLFCRQSWCVAMLWILGPVTWKRLKFRQGVLRAIGITRSRGGLYFLWHYTRYSGTWDIV
jgi:hypothetical protein